MPVSEISCPPPSFLILKLLVGTHELILQSREAGLQAQALSMMALSAKPGQRMSVHKTKLAKDMLEEQTITEIYQNFSAMYAVACTYIVRLCNLM